MTDEQLQELRRLEQAATKGPWEACEREEFGGRDARFVYYREPEGGKLLIAMTHGNVGGNCVDDADFIAAARNALPDLLDEIERLRARVKALEYAGRTVVNSGYCAAPSGFMLSGKAGEDAIRFLHDVLSVSSEATE